MRCWGLVPARGGSKSIAHKNLVPVAGRPLIDYGVEAAKASGRLERIICSTDDAEIAARAEQLGIGTIERPAELATDDAKVDRVAQHFLRTFPADEQPDAVVLIQPTSPFLLPDHVDAIIDLLAVRSDAASAHNVARVSHNLHAWNQRMVDPAGRVSFLFAEERSRARNKQEKPELFAFGNLIAARRASLLDGAGFYAEPAVASMIEAPYDFDLDTAADIAHAETLIAAGLVVLPHMSAIN